MGYNYQCYYNSNDIMQTIMFLCLYSPYSACDIDG